MKPLSSVQRMLAGLAVAGLLGSYVYYAYMLTPLLKQASQLKQEIGDSRRQLQFVRQVIAQGPQLKREQAKLEDEVKRLRQMLPSVEAMPAVIERLSDLARQTGVKIQTILPERTAGSSTAEAPSVPAKPAAKTVELYRSVPIQIDALAGFYQMENFLARLESDQQPMRLQSLRISENPKELRRHTIKLMITGYFSALPPSSS